MSTAILNIPAPRKAEKKKVKLKMAVQGPSGSGKTWGALALATNLWPGARICVVDAENGSSELYADKFEFDTIPLTPPFHTDRYIACIESAVKLQYDVLIIDQISHQWDGEGGILRRKEEMDRRPGANSYTNWSAFTPEHERFKQAIVQAPIHIIATMRSKQDYILVTNDKGRQQPQKVGMASVQREGFDYEFTLAFDVQMDHKATVGKDRTNLFNDQIVDLASPKIAEAIRNWLNSGAESKSEPTPHPATVQPAPAAATSPLFQYENGTLFCSLVEAQERTSKKGETFLATRMNGKIEGLDMAFCFHKSLFDAVRKAINKPSKFVLTKTGQYFNIDEVLFIEGVRYSEGQPAPAQPGVADDGTLITDSDIPF